MATFFAYQGSDELGSKPLGTLNRSLWSDLKTERGARNRCKARWGSDYRLYYVYHGDVYDASAYSELFNYN